MGKHSKEHLTDFASVMQKSEKLFQKILSLAPDMISLHDPEMNIVYSNWKGFGAVPEDKRVFNTKCYKTYRDFDDICPYCQALTVLQTREAFRNEVELPGGTWIDLHVIPILGQDGSVELFVEWVRDITDRKQANEALRDAKRHLDEIIENAPDATMVVDHTGAVIAWNKAIEEMTLVPKKNMLGKGNYEHAIPFYGQRCPILVDLALLPEDKLARVKDRHGFIRRSGNTLLREAYCPETYGGKGAYLWASAVRLRDASGNIIGAIESIRDVTDRKQAEQKIFDYTMELKFKGLEIEKLYQQLNQEIDKARSIHERTLPKKIPYIEGLSMHAYYQPAQRMGGDFYNTTQVDNKLIIYISDVSGHGMEGTLLSAFVKATIDSYVTLKPEQIGPGLILRHLDRQYRWEDYPADYFICILLMVLDLNTMELTYTGAGFQELPLVQTGNGERMRLNAKGPPISNAIPEKIMDYAEGKIQLTPGTTVLISTDGLTDQLAGEEQYNNRLEQLFYEHSHLSPEMILSVIKEDFYRFNGGSLQSDDDITLVIIQALYTGP